jgi:hypothetical protein
MDNVNLKNADTIPARIKLKLDTQLETALRGIGCDGYVVDEKIINLLLEETSHFYSKQSPSSPNTLMNSTHDIHIHPWDYYNQKVRKSNKKLLTKSEKEDLHNRYTILTLPTVNLGAKTFLTHLLDGKYYMDYTPPNTSQQNNIKNRESKSSKVNTSKFKNYKSLNLNVGPRGGKYYMKGGNKIYV